ncbi:hypothetical protein BDV27DRAFT_129806 [Aspergillus caelatus]|uniref:Uncharacterized protein n=1 Tax=Aspergillus caelatus TaxID=61420 RepID=A0A5N7A0U0_9EURO|nr:uncharacterized protein BDV27DRAFT_129806 [Aspergillus caelatus]KAE8363484.1 hypothetical protein BDV27DRAFT_129806 [Aspergillus caelatus]
MRRTLSIMKRPRNTNTPTQPTGGQNQGVQVCNQTTSRRDNTSCANSAMHVRAISALYRSEMEATSDDTNIATEEEVECINEHLPECFCRRCDGDCRNCLQKEEESC